MGTLFQQLYSFVDTIMVGRLIGPDALGAVGTTYSLNFLTLGFVQGACVGFGIPLARTIGTRDVQGFKRYFWNGVWICLALGTVMTVATVLLAEPLLWLIKTPKDILEDARIYIQVIFLGIPASILYNFCAGTLRAVAKLQDKYPESTVAGTARICPTSRLYRMLSSLLLQNTAVWIFW